MPVRINDEHDKAIPQLRRIGCALRSMRTGYTQSPRRRKVPWVSPLCDANPILTQSINIDNMATHAATKIIFAPTFQFAQSIFNFCSFFSFFKFPINITFRFRHSQVEAEIPPDELSCHQCSYLPSQQCNRKTQPHETFM